MNDVFKLKEATADLVIIEVLATDPLTVARHPYVQSNYKYITVTRGEKHVLTVIKTDGTSWNFHWGYGGYTLISEGTKILKNKVVSFIEEDCNIMLERASISPPSKIIIGFNSHFNAWQIMVDGKSSYFMPHNSSLADAMAKACKMFELCVSDWIEKTSPQTGWKYIEAVF